MSAWSLFLCDWVLPLHHECLDFSISVSMETEISLFILVSMISKAKCTT